MDALLGAALRLLPIPLAFAITQRIASRPPRAGVPELEARAMAAARRTSASLGRRLPTWEWGEGPVVCLVHGWGGRASQMAPLGQRLAAWGYRAVAIEVAGHGESSEPAAAWGHFMRDTSIAADLLNPAAIVGHSAGGLAMVAADSVHGIKVPNYICVSSPSHPYPPVRALQRRLNPHPTLVQRFQDHIAGQFRLPWHELERGRVWEGVGENLLLCYDRADRYIQPGDAEFIHSKCSGSTLVWTANFGHSRILGSPELAEAIHAFLKRRLFTREV